MLPSTDNHYTDPIKKVKQHLKNLLDPASMEPGEVFSADHPSRSIPEEQGGQGAADVSTRPCLPHTNHPPQSDATRDAPPAIPSYDW